MEKTIITKGVDLLKDRKHYNQTTIVKKMRYLGYNISEPTFSNILSGKTVKPGTLDLVSKGIQELVRHELGMKWGRNDFENINEQEWSRVDIPALDAKDPSLVVRPGFAFYENGRLSIEQKTAFFSVAQKEVIEFGVTLHTFCSYFFNRAEWEFQEKVEGLLKKGVNFKSYLLDPDCNEARLYFEDRKRFQPEEAKTIEVIRGVIRQLSRLQTSLAQKKFPGTFEIFTYKHIPYNYFMVVDGQTINGKMMISHYIYGESRANCPVIEFTKTMDSPLYKRYWASLQRLVKDAKPITLYDEA
ncbi:MAG: hypothetical protein HUU34_08610 [Saprospiraceae bacterium]|jgi:hypothetical protein|nr:hypothetical protein [Saprospiraceae bacterium]